MMLPFTQLLLFLSFLCLSLSIAQAREGIQYSPYDYVYAGQKIDAELGHFQVPEDHAQPDGKRITLAFVRLKSTSQQSGPPIVYLAGGPGGSGIKLMRGPRGAVFLAMRAAGDVIALDQRGTGLAEPNLECPGSIEFPLSRPGEYPAMLRHLISFSRRCGAYWRSRDVDLAAYNVVQNARDIDALRQALGEEKLRLWASSYGSFLGLAVLRHFCDHVARAVLAGVEGPDDTLKLPELTESQLQTFNGMVATSPALHRRIPDFMALLREILDAAEKQPFVVPVTEAKRIASITLGRADLEQIVAGMLGGREGLEKLPAMLLAFRNRQWSSPLVQSAAEEMVELRTGSLGTLMSLAMDCSSGGSKARLAEIRAQVRKTLLGSAMNFPFPGICQGVNVPVIPQAERMPVHSKVSVLFVSGSLDGRTPVENVKKLKDGFPFSTQAVIEGAGHGNDLFVSSLEIAPLMVNFMKNGEVTTTNIDLPPLRFAIPEPAK